MASTTFHGLRRLSRRAAVAILALTTVATFGLVAPARAVLTNRPPRSSSPGAATPERATDVIPTNIVIGPEAGQNSPPFTIVSVQYVAMGKVSRDGVLDPDHAIAYWKFGLRFVRSNVVWPPFLPEPTAPWVHYFYEMPNGDFTGIGIEPGSPLFGPTPLGANWPQRLVDAAWANVPDLAEQAQAKVKESILVAAGLGAIALPDDPMVWGGIIIAAAGLASANLGPCGAAFATLVAAEVGVWIELASMASATPPNRAGRAVAAAALKIWATQVGVGLKALCETEADLVQQADPVRAMQLRRVWALGEAIWIVSTAGLAFGGWAQAVQYWLGL